MAAPIIRFGDAAETIFANGFVPTPLRPDSKSPFLRDWQISGLYRPSLVEVQYLARTHPQCGVGLVLDGQIFVVDTDICAKWFPDLAPEAAHERAVAIVDELLDLLARTVGPHDFLRVGQPPKAAVFYRSHEPIEQHVGGPIEIYWKPATRQFVAYGRHPDTGLEYQWPGPCNPIDSTLEDMPVAHPDRIVEFYRQAIALVVASGAKARAEPKTRVPGAGHNGPPAEGADIAELRSALEYLIARGWLGPGEYFNHRAVFFSLGMIVHEQPDLREDAISLFFDCVAAAGRDPKKGGTWLAAAIRNAPRRPDGITRRTIFHAAYALGWRPSPQPLTADEREAYDIGQARLHTAFDEAISPASARERAAEILRTAPPQLRRRIGWVAAGLMKRDRHPASLILACLSLAEGRRVSALPKGLA
jgi:hypothetical protein